MKKILICLLVLTTFLGSGLSQDNSCEVYGVVTDSIGNPVTDVTVFIPFSSRGTTTNVNGEYRIDKISAGDIELVFRHLSYIPLTKTLIIKTGEPEELNIMIKSNIIEMAAIIKKANPANWKFGFEKFKEHLIGDPLGRYCEVVNPTDIFFYYDGERLTGHATGPLEIVNKYLGYKLVYFLDYFWYNEDKTNPNGSHYQESFAFSGSAFYVEQMEGNAYRTMTWERNRNTEFMGTLKHLLLSLYHGQEVEQGFDIRQVWTGIQEMQISKNLSPALAYARSMEMDKQFYWDKSLKKSIYLYYNPGEDYPIQSKILDLNQVPPSKALDLADRLIVFYFWSSNHEMEDARVAYLAIAPDESGQKPQLLIDPNGNYTVQGEVIWDYLDTQTKLVTALPADYENQWEEK